MHRTFCIIPSGAARLVFACDFRMRDRAVERFPRVCCPLDLPRTSCFRRRSLSRIIPPTWRRTSLLKYFLFPVFIALLTIPLQSAAQDAIPSKENLLWQKLETTIHNEDRSLDGVLGVAILDLSTGRTLFLNADELLPTASSIKIAILAEL